MLGNKMDLLNPGGDSSEQPQIQRNEDKPADPKGTAAGTGDTSSPEVEHIDPNDGGNVTHPVDNSELEDEEVNEEAHVEEKDFSYVTHTDPARQADKSGTVYLDDLQRINNETARAKIEGREPDYKNPSATVGTPLRPKEVVEAELPSGHKALTDATLPVVVGSLPDEANPDHKDYDENYEKDYLNGSGSESRDGVSE